MPKTVIKNITARQILDSRGDPTVEVAVEAGSARGVFGVPSGASKGSHEALELRDGGDLYSGLGVGKAVENVNQIIAKKLKGKDIFAQDKLDKIMIDLDGTKNKSKLGANAILGVSGAICKAAAKVKKQPLYKYIGSLNKNKKFSLPKPMFVTIEGGLHGDTNLNVQEFMVVPTAGTIAESVRVASEIFNSLKKVLRAKKLDSDLGNEGAYSPEVESNQQALELITAAAGLKGYEKGKDYNLALDVAASDLYEERDKQYVLSADQTSLSAERLVSLLKEWADKYSIIAIEDPLDEEDWEGWSAMRKRLSDSLLVVGDDLFVTQAERLKKGIKLNAANAIIIKPNQVGTITESLATVKLAQDHNLKIIPSHRSGETNDDFIADFAVGVGADYVKFGSVARGERIAKYNRLLAIEEELKQK
ncbi:MAG: phosphopyruvate hydratase [Candidatus Doudnabacteria bacterium]|nr:phosphopyruvate hydratase [Candidatus Doudnabacteria bacterium]